MIKVARTSGFDIGDSPADALLDSRLLQNHEKSGRGYTAVSYRYQSRREKAISIPAALLPDRNGRGTVSVIRHSNY
jgi:hypothetical protein